MLLEPRRLLELDQRRDRVPPSARARLGDLFMTSSISSYCAAKTCAGRELTARPRSSGSCALRVEHVLVRQQGVQDLDDARAVLSEIPMLGLIVASSSL